MEHTEELHTRAGPKGAQSLSSEAKYWKAEALTAKRDLLIFKASVIQQELQEVQQRSTSDLTSNDFTKKNVEFGKAAAGGFPMPGHGKSSLGNDKEARDGKLSFPQEQPFEKDAVSHRIAEARDIASSTESQSAYLQHFCTQLSLHCSLALSLIFAGYNWHRMSHTSRLPVPAQQSGTTTPVSTRPSGLDPESPQSAASSAAQPVPEATERLESMPSVVQEQPAKSEPQPQVVYQIPPAVAMASYLRAPPFPRPGAPEAPLFGGQNITDFLKTWEELSEDYCLSEDKKMLKLPKYCAPIVEEYIESLDSYANGNWQQLCRDLKEEYASQDIKQDLYSRSYLERYCLTAERTKPELGQYCQHFSAVMRALKSRGQLDEYTACDWFLKGLPEAECMKVVSRTGYSAKNPASVGVERLLQAARRIKEDVDNTQRIRQTGMNVAKYDQIISQNIAMQKEVKNPTLSRMPSTQGFQLHPNPPVAAPAKSAAPWREADPVIADLTEQMRSLAIPASMGHYAPYPVQAPPQWPGYAVPGTIQPNAFSYAAGAPSQQAQPPQRAGGISHAQAWQMPQGSQDAGAASGAQGNRQSTAGGYTGRAPPGPCHFCAVLGHHKRDCPELNVRLQQGLIHLNERQMICLGPQPERPGNSLPLRLDPSLRMLDAVDAILKQRGSRQAPPAVVHRPQVATISVEHDSDSEQEYDDLRRNFSYETFDISSLEVQAAATKEPETEDSARSALQPRLDTQRRIVKKRIQEQAKVPSTKNMRTGQYRTLNPNFGIVGEDGQPEPSRRVTIEEITDEDMDELAMDSQEITQPTVPTRVLQRPKQVDFSQETSGKKAPEKTKRRVADLFRELEKTQPTSVLNKMLDAPIPGITFRDLLSSGGEAYKQLFKPMPKDVTDKIRVSQVEAKSQRGEEPEISTVYLTDVLYQAGCPKAMVKLEGVARPALMDSGAEVNILCTAEVERLGLPMTSVQNMKLVSANKEETLFRGIVENVSVGVGDVCVTQAFMVVDVASAPVILGMPYFMAAGVSMKASFDKGTVFTIRDAQKNKKVRFQAVPTKDPRRRKLSHIPGSKHRQTYGWNGDSDSDSEDALNGQ